MTNKLIAIAIYLLVQAFFGVLPDVSSADVPPPPVNQLLGVYDAEYDNPAESDCRFCHSLQLADRHHLAGENNARVCSDCHQLIWDNSCACYVFDEFRNCLYCHTIDPGARPTEPHHNTLDAGERHCSKCHGSLVEDYDDDHYIPDYDISAVTPDPICKTWDGPKCVSGGCRACHTEGPLGVPVISDYGDLHHSVAFDCSLCHLVHGRIRNCETCHGPGSLHNIQADSDNPDNLGIIIPGEENLGWGHIGNGWDCFGCHEAFAGSSTSQQQGVTAMSATPQTYATIPFIANLSKTSFIEGQTAELIIRGEGFMNIADGTPVLAQAQLSNSNTTTELEPVAVSGDAMTIAVPATLQSGNYDLRLVKGTRLSNAAHLSVVPAMVVHYALCRGRSITIKGRGFAQYIDALDSGTAIQAADAGNNAVPCLIRTWEDSRINATCESCPDSVSVDSIWGESFTRVRKLRQRR